MDQEAEIQVSVLSIQFLLSFAWRLTIGSFSDGHLRKCQTPTATPAKPGDLPFDSFAGGLVVNSLLALWLFQRFDMSLAAAAQFFFWSGLCSASSQLAAPRLARRIGLINTMVFTHIPASISLIAAAFVSSLPVALALLIIRSLLSQMDVPARSAFVMAVVTPAERAAAASFTLVPKSLASAAAPTIGGALFAAGLLAAPLVACGALKISYDVAIWLAFRKNRSIK